MHRSWILALEELFRHVGASDCEHIGVVIVFAGKRLVNVDCTPHGEHFWLGERGQNSISVEQSFRTSPLTIKG